MWPRPALELQHCALKIATAVPSGEIMDHLDDLPKRHGTHSTESRAEAAFQKLLSEAGAFILQGSDHKDYGTDCQIEVIDGDNATNVRLHVQLKGTKAPLNADGSVSVPVRRANLNYLLMQPHSVFVCYHVPTDSLRFCAADAVIKRYEHKGERWQQQEWLTVSCAEMLTAERLNTLAALARSGAAATRNMRVAQNVVSPEVLAGIVRSALPDLYVPDDETQAAAILGQLFDSGQDAILSAAFDKFAAVLGFDHDAMGACYMAEINLGMAGRSGNAPRIEAAIAHLASRLDGGVYHPASLNYSIANGFAALGREEEAVRAYKLALAQMADDPRVPLAAECHKNLGSSHEKLGNETKALEHYREALHHNPRLPEAHLALGQYHLRNGDYAQALEHLDQVVIEERSLGKRSAVSGWRINALFNLGDGKAAFREIGLLLGDAAVEDWVWPWCARQVASFGRASPENAKLSVPFWERYLNIHRDCPQGVREWLLAKLYLRTEALSEPMEYAAFRADFVAHIHLVEDEEAAFLWDRLGHWAQDEEDWEEAARCYRAAHDLAGGHYGYCLGTALNFLDQPAEALPLLLAQAEGIQPDDMSWFQVAVANEKLGRVPQSIQAYEKAVSLNPDSDLAWFNMGGVHWNAGDLAEASRVWKEAVTRFPDHELAAKLRRDVPFILR
jgi:tetratricopeptide (TPR) repeat protein